MKLRTIKHRHIAKGPTSPWQSYRAFDSEERGKCNRAKRRGEVYRGPIVGREIGMVDNFRFINGEFL